MGKRFPIFLTGIFLMLLGLVIFQPQPAAAQEQVVVVIYSRALAPYDDAFLGFKDELEQKGYGLALKSYKLPEIKGKEGKFIDELNALQPDLIFTLGTEATLFAKEKISDIPIVFSMVLNPVKNGVVKSLSPSGNNITGVSLNIPVELQFRKLKEILPKIKSVGMLYDAREKATVKEEASLAAHRLNLKLVAKPVYSEKEVAAALNALLGMTDCLWASVDTLIYNPQSAKHILLTTLRNKIPFMAFSPHYVKAGALLALSCDYNDIGRQAAQLTIKVLGGKSAGSIPVASPRKVRLAVNKRTAEIIGITIPQKFLNEAEEIFGGSARRGSFSDKKEEG